MSLLMGGGIAGQTGHLVHKDRKQDKGNAATHLLSLRAVHAWDAIQKLRPVSESKSLTYEELSAIFITIV